MSKLLWRCQGPLHTGRKIRWQHGHLPEGQPLWATSWPCWKHFSTLVLLLGVASCPLPPDRGNLSRGRTIPFTLVAKCHSHNLNSLAHSISEGLAFPTHFWPSGLLRLQQNKLPTATGFFGEGFNNTPTQPQSLLVPCNQLLIAIVTEIFFFCV